MTAMTVEALIERLTYYMNLAVFLIDGATVSGLACKHSIFNVNLLRRGPQRCPHTNHQSAIAVLRKSCKPKNTARISYPIYTSCVLFPLGF